MTLKLIVWMDFPASMHQQLFNVIFIKYTHTHTPDTKHSARRFFCLYYFLCKLLFYFCVLLLFLFLRNERIDFQSSLALIAFHFIFFTLFFFFCFVCCFYLFFFFCCSVRCICVFFFSSFTISFSIISMFRIFWKIPALFFFFVCFYF